MTWSARACRARRAPSTLLVGLAACSSKNDDDGGGDNPNGPSRRIEHRRLLGNLGQRRHRLRQQQRLPAVRRLSGRHRLRAARRARDAQRRPHRHHPQPVGAGLGRRPGDRRPGAAAGPRQHRQLPRAADAVRVARVDAGDDLRRRQRRQRRRQRHRARAWAAATRSAGARRSPPASAATSPPSSTASAAARPNAKIVLLNPPNGAGLPYVADRPRDQLRILQAISVRFSAEANVQASRGVLVVDLMCDPRSYMPQNYSSDGFHPSDSGYAFMAEAVLTRGQRRQPAGAAHRLSADAPGRLIDVDRVAPGVRDSTCGHAGSARGTVPAARSIVESRVPWSCDAHPRRGRAPQRTSDLRSACTTTRRRRIASRRVTLDRRAREHIRPPIATALSQDSPRHGHDVRRRTMPDCRAQSRHRLAASIGARGARSSEAR